MRKLLIILFLTWLPAQITWAAVSVYCQHEGSQHESEAVQSAPTHVGHHEHQHSDLPAVPALPGGAPVDSAPPAAAAHPDCSVCHLSAAVLPALQTATKVAAPARIVALLQLAHPAPPPALPERPNWPPA